MLTTVDHRRDSAGLIYVYPVISRRAGGVSVGINLNINNACNWACVYCQVENLTRGGPPPLDLDLLEQELANFLEDALHGDFMAQHVPLEARQLMDVAFSGNGEPTSAPEFAEAIERVIGVLKRFELQEKLIVRLITNGSLMHKSEVQRGIDALGEVGGEVWFKLDRAQVAAVAEINGVPLQIDKVIRHLDICSGLASTWVQTCWFEFDGKPPDAAAEMAYCNLLKPFANKLSGIHLYGLARPSMQPAAPRLKRIDPEALARFGEFVQKETGIKVLVSP